MENSRGSYQLLIQKLDNFIRKYYINQVIRGTLYTLSLVLVLFLLFNILEHNFFFDKGIRKAFFIAFIGASIISVGGWILLPLLRYFRLGTVISHEKAADIIGHHFGDVKDKLLNVLQLKKHADEMISPDLAYASIDQKTEDIKPVPFKAAIDLSKNRKYLRYALPPLLILLTLLIAAPSMIKDSTARLIRNNEDFEREAPFQFVVQNADDLSVVQYDDFLLSVDIEGDILPNEVFINVNNYQYRLKKDANNAFTYRFKNVQSDTRFNIFSGNVRSKDYDLSVLKKPNILSFEIALDYPGYIGRKDEVLSNIGDLVVPKGTNITWDFNTLNTDLIDIRFSNEKESLEAERKGDALFSLRKRAMQDALYKMYLSNEHLPEADSIQYAINVIPDQYPSISVEKFEDSTDQRLVFFVGDVGDDYGLRSLSFNYKVINANDEEQPLQSLPMDMKNKRQFQYTHTFDIRELNLEPGQEINYYFEVYDNDAVSGSKSSRTGVMSFRMPTTEELEEQEQENNEEIKDDLKKSMKDTKKLQEEMKKMKEKLFQEKKLEWQNRKELEKLLNQQKELQQKLEEAKERFDENMKNQEEFFNPSEKLLEKQEKLQQMFDELMSDEMKEMLEKYQDKLEELEKEGALEMMEEMELNEEQLEKELDRMLELFKQMEVEMEMEKQLQKLEEMAEKLEELSKETEEKSKSDEEKSDENQKSDEEKNSKNEEKSDGEEKSDEDKKSNEELQEKQEKLNEEFDKMQEEMKELEKKNEELERPKDLDNPGEKMEKIDQDMENSMDQLQKQQNKKASESQKNAAQRMRDMAQQMAAQMMSGEMEQMEEDMATLRQLLENLVTLSFDQEDLITQFNTTRSTTSPRYIELVQNQFKIKDDFKVVEDSLQALAKRVIQVETFVTEKVTEIKQNLGSGLTQLEARKKPEAGEHQRRTMKNLNDLALMLSEVMDQMQQQMSSMMPGSQMCNKPGGKGGGKSGRVPMDKISEGQQKLNEDMKKLGKGMSGSGGSPSSKEFAQMAARQAAMRKALRDIQKGKKEQGQGDEALENIIKEMDKVEIDLVNKKLTAEMYKRQQDILTRLLESEKAEREREKDNKRKAETAQEMQRKMPPSLEEYIKKRESEIEQYNTVSPNLKPYYKFLVEEYYNALKKQ